MGAQEKSEIREGANSESEMDLNQTPGSDQDSAKGREGGGGGEFCSSAQSIIHYVSLVFLRRLQL